LVNGQSNGFTLGTNDIIWFAIPVPTNAIYATNRLLFATLPVNIWFSTNLPPMWNCWATPPTAAAC
jgi:hypothetical protein